MDTWRVYKEAFSNPKTGRVMPFLVNYDANREAEYNWVMTRLDAIGLKNGMFSQGLEGQSNLILRRVEGSNSVFHMLELIRAPMP